MDPLATTMFKFYAPTLTASRGSDGEMRIEGVASSTVRDHHGDQITEKALRKMAKSAIGMTIFLDHEYRIKDIFGTVERSRIVKTDEVDEKTGQPIFDMRFGIVVEGRNEEAVRAWSLLQPKQATDGSIKPGTRLGLSIGAMVPEGGAKFDKSDGGRYIVDDLDIVETSVVSMPANPRAMIDYAFKAAFGMFPDKAKNKRLELIKEMGIGPDGEINVAEEQTSEGTGEEMEGIEAAADGTPTELTSEEGEPAEEIESPAEEGPFEAKTVTAEDINEEAPEEIPVEKTKVSIWETSDGKTMVIDTGRSRPSGEGDQSAQDSDVPETAGGPTTSKANELDHPLIKSLTGQLAAMKERHETENAALVTERDAALAIAQSTLDQTGDILKALEAKPVGRKTTSGRFEDPDLEKARVDLDTLTEIYGPEIMKILKKG